MTNENRQAHHRRIYRSGALALALPQPQMIWAFLAGVVVVPLLQLGAALFVVFTARDDETFGIIKSRTIAPL